MTRILDESTFDLVRDAGLAKLLPSRPRIAVGMGTCGTGNGAEGVYHAFANAIERRGLDVQLVQTGCFGFCAEEPLVNVWHPGQPLVMLRRVQTNHVAQVLDGMAGAGIPGKPCPVQDRKMGPRHRAGRLWQRQRDDPGLGRNPVLQRPEKDRSAQLRSDQPRRHRGIYRDRRIPVVTEGAARGRAGTGERAAQTGQAARPRRRRLLDRTEIRVSAKGRGEPEIPHLQRRRGRSGRLHEPQRTRKRPAFAARRHGDRRLCHRRHARDHLCPRGIPAGGPPAERGHRAGQGVRPAGRQYPEPRLRLRHRTGRGRRRIRLRRGNRADQFAGRTLRPLAPAPALPRAEGPLGPSHQHQQRRDLVQHPAHHRQGAGVVQRNRQRPSPGTKVFSLVGKVQQHRPGGNAARHAAQQLHLRRRRRRRRPATTSRRCRPAVRPAAAFRTTCSTRRWTSKRWASSARSWVRAAWW